MQNVTANTQAKRGVLAGLLTFFLGPPLGGVAFGIAALLIGVIETITRQSQEASQGLLELLQTALPFIVFSSMISYALAWAPAAVSAIYVTFRVGFTGWMSWTETVLLAAASLAAASNVQDHIAHGNWSIAASFLIFSVPSALTLRYIAGQTGLVRRPAA